MFMTDALRAEARTAIREKPWSEYRKRRARRLITDMPNGRIPLCLDCQTSPEGHGCLWTLMNELKLEATADDHHCRVWLAPGEVLDSEKTEYLSVRGPYWVFRLKADYGLTVRGGDEYLFIAAAPVIRKRFGYTDPNRHIVVVHAGLFGTGLDIVDLYLVHYLMHGVNPRYFDDHGPEFRTLLSKVYPWESAGPVTAYDSGTPRNVLYAKAKEAIPRD